MSIRFISRMSKCHPENTYYAKGFCRTCYAKAWRKQGWRPINIKALCHPERRHYSQSLCRSCYNRERQKLWRANNSEKHYDTRLRIIYGITYEDYQRMFAEQDGKCKICGVSPRHCYPKRGGLVVDHDHKSLKVRGLLCVRCNLLVGYMEDVTTQIIEKAHNYIFSLTSPPDNAILESE